jgi:hypothetical protein
MFPKGLHPGATWKSATFKSIRPAIHNGVEVRPCRAEVRTQKSCVRNGLIILSVNAWPPDSRLSRSLTITISVSLNTYVALSIASRINPHNLGYSRVWR